MTAFTFSTVNEHVESNLSALSGVVFGPRDDFADVLRDALDDNHYGAPENIYNDDAWSIVSGGDFARYQPECDFSDCKTAVECVTEEAQAILREAYDEALSGVLTTVACCLEQVFSLSESDFTGASRYSVEEIRQVSGARFGDVPHSLEFDLNESAAHSVCVWLEQRELFFKVHGMAFSAELVLNED